MAPGDTKFTEVFKMNGRLYYYCPFTNVRRYAPDSSRQGDRIEVVVVEDCGGDMLTFPVKEIQK